MHDGLILALIVTLLKACRDGTFYLPPFLDSFILLHNLDPPNPYYQSHGSLDGLYSLNLEFIGPTLSIYGTSGEENVRGTIPQRSRLEVDQNPA